MIDAETRRAIDTLSREMQRMQRDVERLRRGVRSPQLAHSTTTGAIDVMDPETEQVRMRIGRLPDGSVGTAVQGGDPPTAPTAPAVEPAPLGLMIAWDGGLANGVALGIEFDHAAVYLAESDDFAAATFQGSIPRSGGVYPVVPLEAGQTYYAWLAGVTTGGVLGDASESASGVPAAVVDGLEPGSITETLIADDSVSTPKLRALAVDAAKIAANAIEAGHITAGAVTASKLAAELVLASVIVAGNPGADRVELSASGLRVYGEDDALIGAFEGGHIALTGDISGSKITGSSFRVEDGDGGYIHIGPDAAALDPDILVIRVAGSDESSIELTSEGAASVSLLPPPGPSENYFAGLQWAYERVASDESWRVPAAVYTSPKGKTDLPSSAQSEVALEGGSDSVDACRVWARGDVIQLSIGGFTDYAHGVVEVDDEMSIRSAAHSYRETVLQAQPTGSGSAGDWVDFTEAQFPSIDFHTGYSGRVRVTIKHCGVNNATPGATLSTGFRLSGASTLAADLSRTAMSRAAEPRGGGDNSYGIQQQQTEYLTLPANADITLTPAWRTSSTPVWGSGTDAEVQYDFSYKTSIVIENLL